MTPLDWSESMKICSSCKESKKESCFSKDSSKKDGLFHCCKECHSAKYYQKRDKKLAYQREWARKNQHKKRQYRQDNKERANARERQRRKEDHVFAMQKRVRSRIQTMFRLNGFSERSETIQMLGCSWEYFCKHIEKQFLSGMSWENRDQWHIDHIIPLASANTQEEVEKLCRYENMRPIWSTENFQKCSKNIYLV